MENYKMDLEQLSKLSIEQLQKEYKYVGEGMARRVFIINNDLVIKIAKNKYGLLQNKIEYYVYTHADSLLKKYLCPILLHTPKITVMKKAIPYALKNGKFIDIKRILQEPNAYKDIKRLAKKFKLLPTDIRFASAWGNLNGKNVLIDYGWPTRMGMLYYKYKFRPKRILGRRRPAEKEINNNCRKNKL